ncbi:RNA-binding domain-containing protein [Methanobacterium sp.]|uniref:RNA-binding domain-containing protein n=1 Tax=Methanobacterium sp. TaxID=2164 RepID=UPI003C7251BA
MLGLIGSKRKGTYWNFKQEPYKDSASLLHDLICLANCHHDGDRYLILGVTGPPKCEIKGSVSKQENRKNQADINDFLSRIDFAGDNHPEIEFQTLKINEKEIDVIIINNKRFKPYFLTKSYGKRKLSELTIYTLE